MRDDATHKLLKAAEALLNCHTGAPWQTQQIQDRAFRDLSAAVSAMPKPEYTHTPEPWRYDPVTACIVADVLPPWADPADPDCPTTTTVANLMGSCGGYGKDPERIVACVNACAGLTDPEVRMKQRTGRLAFYRTQQTALRKALREALTYIPDGSISCETGRRLTEPLNSEQF